MTQGRRMTRRGAIQRRKSLTVLRRWTSRAYLGAVVPVDLQRSRDDLRQTNLPPTSTERRRRTTASLPSRCRRRSTGRRSAPTPSGARPAIAIVRCVLQRRDVRQPALSSRTSAAGASVRGSTAGAGLTTARLDQADRPAGSAALPGLGRADGLRQDLRHYALRSSAKVRRKAFGLVPSRSRK